MSNSDYSCQIVFDNEDNEDNENARRKDRNIEDILDGSFLKKQIGDFLILKTDFPTRWHIVKNIAQNKKTKRECLEIIKILQKEE